MLQLNTFFAVTLPANGAFCNSSLFTAYLFDVAMHTVQLRSVIHAEQNLELYNV